MRFEALISANTVKPLSPPAGKSVTDIVVTKEMIERKAPVFEIVPRSEEPG